MTPSLMERVESFQAELVKRALKWPKHLSNTAALVVVGVQSMRSRILERKLGFLQRVLCASPGSLCGRVVETWCDSITSLCLVKECRELEEMCGVTLTDRMLKGELAWSRSLKEEIRRVDHNLLVERCAVKAPLIVASYPGHAEKKKSGLVSTVRAYARIYGIGSVNVSVNGMPRSGTETVYGKVKACRFARPSSRAKLKFHGQGSMNNYLRLQDFPESMASLRPPDLSSRAITALVRELFPFEKVNGLLISQRDV